MPNHVTGLVFTNQGQRIAISSDDGNVLWWDVLKQIPIITVKEHDTEVRALVVSKDEKLLATGDANGRVVIWEWKGNGVIPKKIDNFEKRTIIDKKGKKVENLSVTDLSVTSLTFEQENRLLAWAHSNGKIRVYDVNNHSHLEPLSGHQAPIISMAFREKGRSLMSLSLDGILIEWSVQAPRCEIKRENKVLWPSGSLHELSVEGKGVTSWGAGNMALWATDPPSSFLKRVNLSKPGLTDAATLSPDGQRIAFKLRDERIIIQDVVNGESVDEISPEGDARPVWPGAPLPIWPWQLRRMTASEGSEYGM